MCARRACVHAVHPPVSATSYKRADFEEREKLFPARFSPISPEFSLQKPAPNLI